eukprot:evm.model.scf_3631.1 EVM.evm.TU.scf_3631.1   scf_3631:6670-12026(-)
MASAEQEHKVVRLSIVTAVEDARRVLAEAKYHTAMLGHLAKEMGKVAGVLRDILTDDGTGSTAPILQEAIEGSAYLARRHTEPFRIATFMRTKAVKRRVEEICVVLDVVVGGRNVGIRTRIDEESLNGDRRDLRRFLTCIWEGKSGAEGLGEGLRSELRGLIREHEERMGAINFILDEDVRGRRPLAQGGNLFGARWEGRGVAVKDLGEDQDAEAMADAFAEVETYLQLRHPSVVQLWGLTYCNKLVMEMPSSDLRSLWMGTPNMGCIERAHLIMGAAGGLEHLHRKGVVHMNVTCANFWVFEDSAAGSRVVKIADLALARAAGGMAFDTAEMGGGDLAYMAPEVHRGQPHVLASDTFGFGVIMYEVMGGALPYAGCKTKDMVAMKGSGEEPCGGGPQWPGSWPDSSDEDDLAGLLALMHSCIEPDPCKRPTMSEVVLGLRRIFTPLLAAEGATNPPERRSQHQEVQGHRLMVAASSGSDVEVRELLSRGVSPDLVLNEKGETSLLVSSRGGHNGVVDVLLNAGANVDCRDNNEWTPLMHAAKGGHHGIVAKLVQLWRANANASDMIGWTPLMLAAQAGHREIVSLLLNGGGSVGMARQ